MPEPEIRKPSTPVTQGDLSEVENALSIRFPPQVRDFYLRTNGGRPYPHLFPKGDERFAIQQFLPIKYPNPRLTVESTYRDLTSDAATANFPKHLVPIGIDGGGDHYCFSAKDEKFGSIYCFSWEHYDDPSRNTIFLADDFDQFVSALTESE